MKLGSRMKLSAIICMADLFLLGGLFHIASDLQPIRVSTDNETRMQEGGDTLDRVKGLEGKYITLTLDDRLHKDHTPQLLNSLKKRGVRATFLPMGQNIEGNEDLIKRMKEERHLVGSHSHSRVQFTKAGSATVYQVVDRVSRMIEDITGKQPQYIRPPFEDWNEELECEVGVTAVLQSVDFLDWELRNKSRIVKRALKNVEDGDITLIHDTFPASVDAALELVDALTKWGYTFVAVNELLIDWHCTVQIQVR